MNQGILIKVIDVIAGLLISVNKHETCEQKVFTVDGSGKMWICVMTENNELHFFWKEDGHFSEVEIFEENFTDNAGKTVLQIAKWIQDDINDK